MNITTEHANGIAVVRVGESRLMYPLLSEFSAAVQKLIDDPARPKDTAVQHVAADITTPEGRAAAFAKRAEYDIVVTNAAGQAVGQLLEMFRRIRGIELAIVHRFVEEPALGGREGGFGVLNTNLSPKPAFCALAAVRGVSIPGVC